MKKELYIVDDNSDHHFLLYKILKQFTVPYPVQFFDDGKVLHQHLVTMEQQKLYDQFPALIILDLNMPGINGLQLLRMLKQPSQNNLPHYSNIPVIMLSNEMRDEKIRQCYQAGASAFVMKQMNHEMMKKALQTTCEFWLEINCSANQTFAGI